MFYSIPIPILHGFVLLSENSQIKAEFFSICGTRTLISSLGVLL